MATSDSEVLILRYLAELFGYKPSIRQYGKRFHLEYNPFSYYVTIAVEIFANHKSLSVCFKTVFSIN